jgi:hypothetical protein
LPYKILLYFRFWFTMLEWVVGHLSP